MPKGKKEHTTPHICIPITNPRRNIPSHRDQQARYRLQHSVLDSLHQKICHFVELCKMAKIPLSQQISILQTWNQESGYSPPHQQTTQQQQPVTHNQKYQLTHSNQAKSDYTPGSCILLKPQFWISEAKRSLQHWIWLTLFMSYVYVPHTVIPKKNLHQMAEGKEKNSQI